MLSESSEVEGLFADQETTIACLDSANFYGDVVYINGGIIVRCTELDRNLVEIGRARLPKLNGWDDDLIVEAYGICHRLATFVSH